MFDGIAADKSACASQAGFAMDSDGLGFLFSQGQELLHDGPGGTGPVGEVEFVVGYSCGSEGSFIVGLVVESDYCAYSKFLENGDIVFGGEVSGLYVWIVTPCSSLFGS